MAPQLCVGSGQRSRPALASWEAATWPFPSFLTNETSPGGSPSPRLALDPYGPARLGSRAALSPACCPQPALCLGLDSMQAQSQGPGPLKPQAWAT